MRISRCNIEGSRRETSHAREWDGFRVHASARGRHGGHGVLCRADRPHSADLASTSLNRSPVRQWLRQARVDSRQYSRCAAWAWLCSPVWCWAPVPRSGKPWARRAAWLPGPLWLGRSGRWWAELWARSRPLRVTATIGTVGAGSGGVGADRSEPAWREKPRVSIEEATRGFAGGCASIGEPRPMRLN